MLVFKSFDIQSIPDITSLIREQFYRTCDYSIGGIYMWIRYFDYAYCIFEDMLYIKCRLEDRTVFMLPVGRGSLSEAINNLREYCSKKGFPLQMIAVPEHALATLPFGCIYSHTRKWDDYLYIASELVTYDGHALKNKRNRMNHFVKSYDFAMEKLCEKNISEVRVFVKEFMEQNMEDDNFFREYENEETLKVLDLWESLPFEGELIRIEGKIAGIIVGETVKDTLFIHIEKANRAYSGINELLTSRFIAKTMQSDSKIMFVNREEDMGDEGLRRSKISFNPRHIIEKYTVDYE